MDSENLATPSGTAEVLSEDASCESHDLDKESRDADAKSHDSNEESHDKGPESHGAGGKSGDSTDDRYSYMQRGFTSEIFKIEINNIPQHVGYQVRSATVLQPSSQSVRERDGWRHEMSVLMFSSSQQIKKYLKGLKLNPVKIKKPHKTFCYVTFRSEEDRKV